MSKPNAGQASHGQLLSDEELHGRIMSDPEVRARIEEALAAAKSSKGTSGITAEELPDFLREHGWSLDPLAT